MSVFTTGDRIAFFQRKLEFWKSCVDGRQNEFLIETESSLEESFEWFATGVSEILLIFY